MIRTKCRRAVIGVAALALIATSSGVVAAQAAKAPALVVHAAHTASSRLVLTTLVTLPQYNGAEVPAGVVSTTGNYSAIVIYQNNKVVYGLAVDRDIGMPVTWGLMNPTLPRGTYTVVVVAQRAVTFTLPLRNTKRTFSVTASKPTKAQRIYTDANTGQLEQVGSVSIPLQLTADTAVLSEYIVDRPVTVFDTNGFCISRTSGSCANGGLVPNFDDGLCGPCRDSQGIALYPHTQDSLPPGSYYIVAEDTDVGIGEQMLVVTYIFG